MRRWAARSSFFCQFEYSIPVIEEVRVAVFYDIGFVNGDSFDFSTSKIVSDYGIGLRLNLAHRSAGSGLCHSDSEEQRH